MDVVEPPMTVPLGRPKPWQTVLAYAIAAACLVWVLRDINPVRLWRETREMDWRWAALATVANILSYAAQGWRWELLLRPVSRLSVLQATRAIYAGLFVNQVLPMRTGEVLRAYLVARRLDAKVSSIVPSIVVERLFDGLWLAFCAGAMALILPLPKYLVHAADILGVGVLLLTAAVIFAILRAERRPDRHPHGRTRRLLNTLACDLREIGTSGVVFESAFGSLLLLAGQMLAFWMIMRAYGIHVSFWNGAAVLVIMHIGTLVPSAPANAGPFQFFTVVGLELFGVERQTAAAFSLVVFCLLALPLVVLGFFALSQSGLTLAGARREVSQATAAQMSPPACAPPENSRSSR